MHPIRIVAAVAAAFFAAAAAQAGCYTVMNAKGEILLQTSTPPVDMSFQLHQTVPERFGKDARMTFGIAEANCGPVGDPFGDSLAAAGGGGAAAGQGAPKRGPKADRG